MIKIIITGHGHFASGLISAAELIIGENHLLEFVEFTKDTSPQQLKHDLSKIVEDAQEKQILILSDLVGGTPYKTGADIAHSSAKKVTVIGGTNLSMVIEASLTLSNESQLPQFACDLIGKSRLGIDIFQIQEDDYEEDDIL